MSQDRYYIALMRLNWEEEMSQDKLFSEVEQLEKQLKGACLEARLALQPDVTRVLERMRQQGVQIPARLRQLDAALCEDVMEARFDNLPI